MTHFSCVVIGEESLLIGCGDMLLDRGHTIRAVVARDPEIIAWAQGKGLATLADPADLTDTAAGAPFHWLFSIANLRLLPEAVLALPRRGAINFHDGPLPRYAGLNAPVWAIINRESAYGVTWHMLEGGIDKGDILEQVRFDIAPDETAFSLNSKCYGAALDSFAAVLAQLGAGKLQRRPQDLSQRSYCARDDRPAAAGRLDFGKDAETLAALVRGLDFGDYPNPLLCPKIEIAGRPVLVRQADVAAMPVDGAPGTVLACDADGLVVATTSGAIALGGLCDSSGVPLDASRLVDSGDVLVSPDAATAAALEQAVARSLPDEPYWRQALHGLQPMPVPQARRATAAPDWARREIPLARSLDEAQAGALVLAWALRCSGEAEGDVACRDAAMAKAEQALPGYVSGWVPLHVCGQDSLEQTATQIAPALERMHARGGFACDLMARDPLIAPGGMPDVGLSLGLADPIAGTAVTVALSDDQRLIFLHDRARLGDDAADLIAARLGVLAGAETHTGTIDTVPLLPASERQRLIATWNRTAHAYDATLTVHGAFEAQVARSPDALAVVFEDRELTYRALNERANAIAARLRALGVGPGDPVGLCLRRTPDLLAGALAVLKAGGAYVPLDPAYPADRLAHYLRDSGAQVVLSETALAGVLPPSDAKPLMIDDANAVQHLAENVDGGAGARDLAYVIYTSGSTGTPKGVMVEHRNVANFFAGMDDRIDHDAGGVWLAVTSLAFDISVLELFWTLARGFKVVLGGDENRAAVSRAPIAVSDRHIDFNLFFWGNDDGPGPRKYRLLLEGAKFADANGFNAIWTPERHFHAFGGPYPNPAVTGAAVAAVTSNLSVRAGSCVAPLHHPARIAEDWSVIDNLTDGRAGLGIAAGWQPHDFVLRPENSPPANKPAMYAAIDTLRRLWRGEAVEFPLQNGTMHAVVTQPRPVSRELPIWVTTAGNPDTWKEAGQIGANVLTHLLGQSVEEVAGKIKIYHEALREAGHDPADFKVTLMLHTYLAETRAEAERVARGPMKDYLRSAAGLIKQFAWVFPAFKRPEGVNNAFEMDLGVLGEDELEAILEFAFMRYFEDSGLFGTVEDGVARAEQLKRIGVDEIACLIDYGIAPEQVLEGLKPLAEVLKRANAATALEPDDFSVAAQILRHNVTHLQCTPSMARIFALNDEARLALGRVRHLMLGGEPLPGDLVNDLRGCTTATIQNMYGPTETTIWSTSGPVPSGASGIVGIGTPIANTTVYVLDRAGQPAPIGVPGELYIGGDGVTRGYWLRDDLTAGRFLPDPFAQEAGLDAPDTRRMYRTGDLARWRSDGQLDFLGRGDHQVKIRGQRVELGEIESILTDFSRVTGAVAVAKEAPSGGLRLVAYVTTSEPVAESTLRRHLELHLPEAMIPAHIVTLDRFPLTPNRKIDRMALPEPARTGPDRTASRQPEPGAEAQIAKIWSRILGVADIRPDDNFFAIGGHSLLAVQAHRELRKALHLPDLSITDIFRFPTLGALAQHVGGGQPPAPTPDAPAGPAPGETMSKRRAMRAGRRVVTG